MNVLNGVVVGDVSELVLDEKDTRYDKAAIAAIGERDGVTLYWVGGESEMVTRGTFGSPDVPFTHRYTYPVEVRFDPAILSMAEAIGILVQMDGEETWNGYWEKDGVREVDGNVAVSLHLS